jgi:hypothetical protein
MAAELRSVGRSALSENGIKAVNRTAVDKKCIGVILHTYDA